MCVVFSFDLHPKANLPTCDATLQAAACFPLLPTAMSSEPEVVRLLKPDSQGHMQRIFSAYSFSSGTLEVLALPSFPTLLNDLIASGPLALPAPLDDRALFMVRSPPLLPSGTCDFGNSGGKLLFEFGPSLTPHLCLFVTRAPRRRLFSSPPSSPFVPFLFLLALVQC